MKFKLSKKINIIFATLIMCFFIFSPFLITYAIKYTPLEEGVFNDFSEGEGATGQLGKFLAQAFQFGLAIAAALAVIMIVWGGVEVMLSESVFSKDSGKKKIWDAIWGLILALCSWLILYTINPDILNFKL